VQWRWQIFLRLLREALESLVQSELLHCRGMPPDSDRARTLPVLLLITYRPEFTPPWAGHAHATAMVLNRLDRRQVTAMADQITGKPLPREARATARSPRPS
jgi:hypothetical protein